MEIADEIKEISEKWLSFDFLKKFKEIGENYMKQIKGEKTYGNKECI